LTLQIAGELLEKRPDAITLGLPLALSAASAVTFFACAALPRGTPALRQARPFAAGALASPRFLVFLGAATLLQGSHAVFYAFSVLHWQSLGIGSRTISLLWNEGVVAEILLFYWGAPLLRRTGPLDLMVLAGGAGLLRWTVTAFATSVPILAVVQLLHALTFAAAHLGAMHHLARTIPAEQGATAQAIYGAVVGGIGLGFLVLLAGALYGAGGGLAYLAMAGLAAAGGVVSRWLAATES
jgi:PPP family 3-phenylpropionic acid transporter